MLPNSGFVFGGLFSDFPRQSKGCDFMLALGCLITVPLSANREQQQLKLT